MPDAFTPILYVYPQCPFCFKVRLFLLEAGLLDKVGIVEVEPGSAEEKAVREKIGAHLEKVSFPTLETGPDAYMGESDAIIAWFEQKLGADHESLPTLGVYLRGPFASQIALFKENRALKDKLGEKG